MLAINGVELDFDVTDVDTIEAYEEAFIRYQESVQKAKEVNGHAEGIRVLCHATFDVFNDIFGEGTDKALFGERTSLNQCIEAIEALVAEANKQRNTFTDKLKKYSPNRAQRRAR